MYDFHEIHFGGQKRYQDYTATRFKLIFDEIFFSFVKVQKPF
jgi:hypothetical protein